jgi:glucose-6-phosphate 1-dehydrogenase
MLGTMANATAPASIPKVKTPTTLVIFGATGALSSQRLLPTVLKLAREGALPDDFRLIGVSRQKLSDEMFRSQIVQVMQSHAAEFFDEDVAKDIAAKSVHVAGDLRNTQWVKPLREALEQAEEGHKEHKVIFYLATAPSLFASALSALGETKLVSERHGSGKETAIIVEKPFGHDLASAKKLNEIIGKHFREDQIYRIDHYLGKDTVQNLLAFRFENGLFEPIWNHNYIDHVQITLAEPEGIGQRGRSYEEAGALRDVIQNHLLQLLAHVAMEPPSDLSSEQLRDRRAQVLRCLRPLQPSELEQKVIRGQYGPGEMMTGKKVKGYLDEEFVASGSTTETFVALPVELMNERWIGVPFYLRAGKRLPKDVTEITLQFKPSVHNLYHKKNTSNLLTFRIQPNEGIALRLFVKEPGYQKKLEEVDMSFCYRDSFLGHLPTAYDRLLLDCLNGDQSSFTRADEIIESWRFVEPILQYWDSHRPPEFPNYAAGTWGPRAADNMMAADNRQWWSDRLDVCPIPGAGQAVTVAEKVEKAK